MAERARLSVKYRFVPSVSVEVVNGASVTVAVSVVASSFVRVIIPFEVLYANAVGLRLYAVLQLTCEAVVGSAYPVSNETARVPEVVIGLPDTVKPVGTVISTLVSVPPVPVAEMVIASVEASVARVTPEPATNVSVSSLASAVMVSSPATATLLNMFWLEPLSAFAITPVEELYDIPSPADTDARARAVVKY
jgi:hypothetical protein